jgi:hypothetical protein
MILRFGPALAEATPAPAAGPTVSHERQSAENFL